MAARVAGELIGRNGGARGFSFEEVEVRICLCIGVAEFVVLAMVRWGG